MKYEIRKMAIWKGKEIERNKRLKEDNIIQEIIAIHGKEHLAIQDKDNLNMLQLEPDSIYEEEARGAFVRSRTEQLDEGGEEHKILL